MKEDDRIYKTFVLLLFGQKRYLSGKWHYSGKARGVERLLNRIPNGLSNLLLIEAQSGEKYWSNMYFREVLEKHDLREVLQMLFVGITMDELSEPDLDDLGKKTTLALQSPAILDAK